MGTTTQLMTFAEFEKLSDSYFPYCELRHGELIRVPPPEKKHTDIQRRLRDLLIHAVREAGVVITELPFRALSEGEYRVADVGYVSDQRWRLPAKYFQGAPELVAEVLSPSNSAAEIEDLQNLCLENGSLEFWVVNGDLRQVKVSTPDGITTTYRSGQSIPLRLFGEGSLPVDEIFEK